MLSKVIGGVIGPRARETDRRCRFPRAAVDALGEAGVLGSTVDRSLGGDGRSLADAVSTVRQVARACASTATVLQCHFTAVAVLARFGPRRLCADIAAGSHLGSCAVFDDTVPGDPPATSSRASAGSAVVRIDGSKPLVTAAGEADSYLWSTRALDGSGTSLWLVSAAAPGLHVPAEQEALGLRGSGARSVTADPVTVPADALLGANGDGERIVQSVVLPWFCALGAAVSLGIMDSAVAATKESVAAIRAPRPGLLAELARIRLRADSVAVLLRDAVADPGVASGLALRAMAIASAVRVTDLAMKISQAASASTEASIAAERRFRDARASYAIPPTQDSVFEHIGATLLRNG